MSAPESLRDEVAVVIEGAFCVISGSSRTCEIHEERTEGGRCPRTLSAADTLLASPALARVIREAKAQAWDEGRREFERIEDTGGYASCVTGDHGQRHANPYRNQPNHQE